MKRWVAVGLLVVAGLPVNGTAQLLSTLVVVRENIACKILSSLFVLRDSERIFEVPALAILCGYKKDPGPGKDRFVESKNDLLSYSLR